jgi:hypothetical protein
MADETPKKNPWPLRIVLLAILLVMILALVRDRWADAQYRAAWRSIEQLHRDMIEQPGDVSIGPDEVAKTIGWRSRTGEPVAKDHYFEETYQLRRGLPWQRYFIYVVYRNVDGKPVFYHPFQGRMPEATDVPARPVLEEDLLKASEAGGGDESGAAKAEGVSESPDSAAINEDVGAEDGGE